MVPGIIPGDGEDEMTAQVLPQTTLAMIVRDEEMNPAGGISRCLDAILPHVEEAVVVDTGSVDNTRKILAEFKEKYPYLRVYNRPFDTFADSRNYSLSLVKTEKALVLDADEIIREKDFEILSKFMREKPAWGYFFTFSNVYPDGSLLRNNLDFMNPRIFGVENVRYENDENGTHEDIPFSMSVARTLDSPVDIFHFKPSKEADIKKKENWYNKREYKTMQPSEAAKKDGWKEFNGGRNIYW